MNDKVTPTQAEITEFLDALENISSHGLRLIRFVDGEGTYEARCGDDVAQIVGDTDDVYDWIIERKHEHRSLLLMEFLARHASQARAEGLAEGKLIGARLGLEAAVNALVSVFIEAHDTEWDAGVNCARQLYHDAIRALSPADVVKGGE